jgi:hypothetical protein
MAAALPMLVLALFVQHFTVNAVLMIVLVSIDSGSLAKDIYISLILGHLLGIALAADMLI